MYWSNYADFAQGYMQGLYRYTIDEESSIPCKCHTLTQECSWLPDPCEHMTCLRGMSFQMLSADRS